MLGPSPPNLPYSRAIGLGAPRGRSPMYVTFCFPLAPGPSLPIGADATRIPSSCSTEANVQGLYSTRDAAQVYFRLTSI